MEYHVSKNGNDGFTGSTAYTFRSIQKAADIALPGDTIIVHAGVYREWVNPVHGGTEKDRIVYMAAPGEQVTISGAEVITDWEKVEGTSVWKTSLPNSFFGGYNPYEDILFGDWLNVPEGKRLHTGEVYLNGRSFYEAQSLEEVKHPVPVETSKEKAWSVHQWYGEVKDGKTTIWVNFHGADPTKECVEINVRPYVFWPKENLRSCITVKGFTLKQAATNWAPPTAFQGGLVGPHWAKGWVIEDNVISDSKCSGISLGKEISTGQNEWSLLKFKQGTQREREVIFRAARGNWNKETIGSHVVRNNTIFDCGQTGVVGHLGGVFSLIENNHIFRIHQKHQIEGAEIAGIKMHAAIDTTIRNNVIHDAFRGLWCDWQTQGTHITRNVFWNNDAEDLFVEVSHGPYLVDHNIFLSKLNYRDLSQGGALVHNFFTGKIAEKPEMERHTPYHFPHETEIAGTMTISGGDVRYYNNLFIGDGDNESVGEKRTFWLDEVPLPIPADATLEERVKREHEVYVKKQVGTSAYDDCPCETDPTPWDATTQGPAGTPQTDAARLPVFIKHNVYLAGAKPYAKESGAVEHTECGIEWSADSEKGRIVIKIANPALLASPATGIVSTAVLGRNLHAEMLYEEKDGTPIVLDTDFYGNARAKNPTAGPFEATGTGPVTIEIGYEKVS
jgi:hypothetical protein